MKKRWYRGKKILKFGPMWHIKLMAMVGGKQPIILLKFATTLACCVRQHGHI